MEELKYLLGPNGERIGAIIPNWPGTRSPPADPEQTEREIAEYIERNKYPPTTNRLRKTDRDLLDPNRRHEREQPAQSDPEVMVLYTGSKLSVVGKESFDSWLYVKRDDTPVVPVKILQATAKVLHREGSQAVPLTYALNNGVYVNSFPLWNLAAKSSVTVEFSIFFEWEAGKVESRAIRIHYTPDQEVPARFTGTFRDVIENGSLVVYAGVQVAKAGFYLIDCNLYGRGGELVAWTRYKGDLAAGQTEARLLFFGKLLRDVGVPPPYTIGQLRGARRLENVEPDTEEIPFENFSYTTKTSFTLDQLSDAVYDSPHKQEMIRLMRQYGLKPAPPGSIGGQ
jgi:hypothetical protein